MLILILHIYLQDSSSASKHYYGGGLLVIVFSNMFVESQIIQLTNIVYET